MKWGIGRLIHQALHQLEAAQHEDVLELAGVYRTPPLAECILQKN